MTISVDLPHPVTRASITDFLNDNWSAQIKYDGVRLAVVYGEDGIYGLTKNGKETFAPSDLPEMPVGTVVDGELLGDNSWQSAQAALSNRDSAAAWVAFDLLNSNLPFPERYLQLKENNFKVLDIAPVYEAWETAKEEGKEGIVVRPRIGPEIYKIKFRNELDVILHRGKLFVLKGKTPHLVGSMPRQANGKYRVSCEGRTSKDKIRAPRIIGPALSQTCSFEQLNRIRRG